MMLMFDAIELPLIDALIAAMLLRCDGHTPLLRASLSCFC